MNFGQIKTKYNSCYLGRSFFIIREINQELCIYTNHVIGHFFKNFGGVQACLKVKL